MCLVHFNIAKHRSISQVQKETAPETIQDVSLKYLREAESSFKRLPAKVQRRGDFGDLPTLFRNIEEMLTISRTLVNAQPLLQANADELKNLANVILDFTRDLEKKYFRRSLSLTSSGEHEMLSFQSLCVSLRWIRMSKFRMNLRNLTKSSSVLSEVLLEKLSRREADVVDSRMQPSQINKVPQMNDVKIADVPLPPDDATQIAKSEVLRPAWFSDVQSNVVLDFESIYTPEGSLKAMVLEPGESLVVAASGAGTNGVLGMGGVGKTVAMTGLASQFGKGTRFEGGIYFLSFGQEATTETVIGEIASIVAGSGGVQCAQQVSTALSAAEAARIAAKWFYGKACLFLCDDLWPTHCPTGFFQDLRILVRCDPRSRMVVTTRDANITHEANTAVRFGARDPAGPVSRAMFFMNAAIADHPRDVEFEAHLKELLFLCGGLPLLLAVVGRRISEDVAEENISTRMRNRVKELKTEVRRIQELQLPANYPVILHAAVMLSVKYLGEFKGLSKVYTIEQMFQSLSLLSNQGWIPISVLSRLWKVDADVYVRCFSRFRLVTVKFRSWKNYRENYEHGEEGVMVHDLTLDICRLEASLDPGRICWHQALLNSYHEARAEQNSISGCTEVDSPLDVSDQHRPWWSDDVKEDGYIHNNLSRHLVASGRRKELWSLLLNPSWSKVWIHFGTFAPLQRDLASLVESMKSIPGEKNKNVKNLDELTLVYRALRCAWGRIVALPREYPYQMLGRLSGARGLDVVNFFLKQVESTATRPWLRPLYQCLEDPRGRLDLEVHFAAKCYSLAYFPNGKEVAAAVGSQVHVIDVQYGNVLLKCTGHRLPVRKVAVSSDGTWFVSADDQDIRVWSKPAGVQVGQEIVCDNSTMPKDGSLVIRKSGEGYQIYATVKQELKSWDLNSRAELTRNFDRPASFIAFTADGRQLMCSATRAKTVTVLNMDDMSPIGDPLTFRKDYGKMVCVVGSRDGKSIACGTNNGRIIFWDRDSDELRTEELSGHVGIVLTMAISRDARLLFSGSSEGDVRMWDLKYRDRPGKLIGKHTNGVTSLAVSPDGTRLVSGSLDTTMRVWDVKKDIYANDGNEQLNLHSGPVTCITSTPNGRFVISGSEDREVRVWDAESGVLSGDPLTGHTAAVQEVAVNDDSSIVYSWSDEAICWNLNTRKECFLTEFFPAAAPSEEGRALSLQYRPNGAVECIYKSCVLAQISAQKTRLHWHIDHRREIVHVGLQNGTIMSLKVEP